MELTVERGGREILCQMHQNLGKFTDISIVHCLSVLQKYYTVRKMRNILGPMIVVGLFLDIEAVKKVVTICSSTTLENLEYARLILRQVPNLDTFTYNSVIRGCLQSKIPSRALSLYYWMLLNGVFPDKFTFPFVLKACAGTNAIADGEKVHCRIFKSPLSLDLFVQASILAMYSKCGEVEMARLTFDFMPHKSLVSWNTMIDAYVKHGYMDSALELFNLMPERDVFSWNVMIDGHAKHGQIEIARYFFNAMFERDGVTWNIMIDGYAKCGNVKFAREFFDIAPFKDIVTWGIMINGYVMSDHIGVAHSLFEKTPYKSLVTWNSLICGYAKCGDMIAAQKMFELMPFRNQKSWNIMLDAYVKCGKIKHANQTFCAMPNKDVVSWNILIDGHSKLGDMEIARELFDTMPYKDVVSWNAILGGYKQNGHPKKMFELFVKMQVLKETPDCSTLAILLSGIADLGLFFHGRQVHAYVCRKYYSLDSTIGVALIDMYSKCGFAGNSMRVFDMITSKNLDHWNALLSGLASLGCCNLVVTMFAHMCLSIVRPDDVTFVSILKACSHSGLVSDGFEYFIMMRESYGITPNVHHYGCMVDLLSRSGRLEEAVELVRNMPVKANDVVWRALLGASRTHGNIEVAKLAARHLIELVPNDSSAYVLLANIYGDKGRFGSVQNVWRIMKENEVLKNTACSYIELQCELHQFTAGDASHPHVLETLLVLNGMIEGLSLYWLEINYELMECN
ncbi:pentatricopeptide repeat-containing protein At2g45350, chloroplastic isoform X1 [Phalaenopsis equestris]|uniref:pentatricopeptide repeat-containing protein At2g45350, chloroplastic isoform X1 n=1 Tax=Phalaenopsis equestris TaxID=78828 RepID=UPI0009E2DDB6|nr:pentatricopeptide repeat-containing protein At2g45350, chloroplastic isoform X1 [Phalaenopsis equestris]